MPPFLDIFKLSTFLKLKKKDLLLDHKFPMKIPFRLASKIKKGDISDPILRQFVPLKEEAQNVNGYSADPLNEKKIKNKNLLCRYKGRALLLCSNECAMHCRYCFRKNQKYKKKQNLKEEINFLNKKQFEEVILSGGDPLALTDRQFQTLICALNKLPFLKRIRIHTRYLIGYPERISKAFLQTLTSNSKRLVMVIQVNHPKEIDEDVKKTLCKLLNAGVTLFSQSVLLKGVNDNLLTLKELYVKLGDVGVIPYYLHQLDKVAGAAHFAVNIKEGKKIVKELRETLPGYLVPRYVVDNQSFSCKTIIL